MFVVLLILVGFAAVTYLYRHSRMGEKQGSSPPGGEPAAGKSSTIDATEDHQTHAPSRDSRGEGRRILYWQDPMNPAYRSDTPGKAPDGMDLVPVYAGEGPADSTFPPGTVRISPEKQQLIGVKYGEVGYRDLSRSIRTVGRLVTDETKIVRVQTKVSGWIEEVHVDFIGKLVRKNQPLISIYSPELVSTQQEFLLANRAREQLKDNPVKEIAEGALSLYESARKRLRLWDISEEQIRRIEESGSPAKTMTLYSPITGFVQNRNAFAGQRVTPETELYTIADLSTIWILADIYEFEVPLVKVGQKGSVTLPYFPERTFSGKITYIYPQFDFATRTLKVRLEVKNPDFELKPNMFANVELQVDFGRQLSLPEEAVLDSGNEQTVFVAREGGHFEPRRVRLGPKVGGFFIVRDGVGDGERVVTSANFLIDSESQLKTAVEGMSGTGHAGHGIDPKGDAKRKKEVPKSDPHPRERHDGYGGPKVPESTDTEDHGKHPAHEIQPEEGAEKEPPSSVGHDRRPH